MRKSASWAPAPNLKVLAVERNETDWIVAVDGLDHATCPNDWSQNFATDGSGALREAARVDDAPANRRRPIR